MPFNGAGTFTRIANWVLNAAQNINILPDLMDNDTQDIANGLSMCITKDGQQTVTANIPFNGFKLTGVGNPTLAQDGVTLSYMQTYVAGLYAPLLSPALTGTPTAPTAALGTNTTQIATMAALLAQAMNVNLPNQAGNAGKYATTNGSLASWGSIGTHRVTRTSNTNLVASDKDVLIDVTSGSFTQTIDAAANLGDRWFCRYRNLTTGNITIDPSGAETIDGLASGVVTPGMAILIVLDSGAFYTMRIGPNTVIEVVTAGTAWVCPLGAWRVKLRQVGGGGSGAKTASTGQTGSGSGAGYLEKYISVVPGTSYVIAIGAGGAGKTVAGNGNAGGVTTFNDGTTTYTANGGAGGSTSGSVAGGTAVNGDINIQGGTGMNSSASTNEINTAGGTPLGSTTVTISSVMAGYGNGSAGGANGTNSATASPGVIILEY